VPINASQAVPRSTEPRDFTIRFPERLPSCDQDEEWFEVLLDGEWRRYRLHDYAELFEVPGLYEALATFRPRPSPRRSNMSRRPAGWA
jgi:hypothetical protein